MIIRFFRKDYVLQYVALLLLQLLLWLPAFIFPDLNYENYISFTSPGYKLILWIIGNNPRVLTAIAFIIVFFSALILNKVLDQHQLVSKNNMVPAFIYVVLMSHQPVFLSLNPTLIANLFVIISLHQLFTLYMEKEAYSKVFNIGIFLAIGSLFYFEVLFLLIFLWFTYNVYRVYNWREWIIPVLGIITIYLFLGVYYFWTDQLSLAFEQYQLHMQGLFSFQINIYTDYLPMLTNGAVFLLAFFAFVVFVSHLNEYIISVRKHYLSSIILLFTTIAIVLFTARPELPSISLLMIPFSIIISGFLLRLKRPFWIEVYIWLLLTLILVHNYYAIISPKIFD